MQDRDDKQRGEQKCQAIAQVVLEVDRCQQHDHQTDAVKKPHTIRKNKNPALIKGYGPGWWYATGDEFTKALAQVALNSCPGTRSCCSAHAHVPSGTDHIHVAL